MTTDKKLTAQQEVFALALASGVLQAEAYRRANPRSKTWADTSVWPKASHLAALPQVKARIAELKALAARKTLFTLSDHLVNLEKISRAALKAGDFNAAARAEEARGKASGFYVQKTELTGKGGGPIETRQTRDLTAQELAEELAKHGIQP